jgi:hypothetical protein
MKRNKNIFDKIGSLIPGYRGYSEKDSRRNCDKLLRNRISDQLLKVEDIVRDRLKLIIMQKKINDIELLESLRKKVNTLSDKVRFAPYGESSFFADSKIDEDELEKIYEYDFYLLIDLEKINKDLVTSNLEEIIDKIYKTLDERNIFIGEHK